MTELTRRMFLVGAAAGAGVARGLVPVAGRLLRRPVLRLVYDRKRGMMRAVDRLVP